VAGTDDHRKGGFLNIEVGRNAARAKASNAFNPVADGGDGSDVLDAKLVGPPPRSSLNFASAGLTTLSSSTSISQSTEG